MQNSKPRILIISSVDPSKGPGVLAANYYEAFINQSYEVDVLTLNKSEAHPNFLYVKDPSTITEKINSFIQQYRDKIYRRIRAFFSHSLTYPHNSYHFFYFKEENPPVNVSSVLKKIKKPYDIVYILFWQNMISFATVRAIYQKLHCLIFFGGVDYSQMAGGCHFTNGCQNFKTGCGCCPAFESKNPTDFTYCNVTYRKGVYDEVKPIVCGNTYMIEFYKQSLLLKDYPNITKTYPIIDTSLFKPLSKTQLHKLYGISEDKTFKILFGCQSITDERKGIKYLIEALNIFADSLSEEERSQVLVMAIGKDFDAIESQLHGLESHDFGYVGKEELAKLYAFADVFLSPSVNDAGPMMVNQSLCCGTPIVGFEMGSCLDAVKDMGTGYCVPLRDSQSFAEAIEKIYRQTPEERETMCNKCVDHAQNTYSYDAAVMRIIEVYYTYKMK